MVISVNPSNAPVFLFPQKQDYIEFRVAETVQLDMVRMKLDMALLAIKVLTGITSDNILRVASKFNVPPKFLNELALILADSEMNPINREEKKISHNQPLKVEEAQSFIVVICHLAKQNQPLIRRAVALMEQMAAQNHKPESVTLLKEYLCNFKQAYQQYHYLNNTVWQDNSEEVALKVLVDLLFYSAPQGCSRLFSSIKCEEHNQSKN